MSQAVEPGDRVKIHYTTKSLEGCVIETSENREPLEFVAGCPEIVRGVSRGVLGMQAGESRTLTVAPEHGFGRQRKDLVQMISRSHLPEGASAGDQLNVTSGDREMSVWVQRIVADEAVIDGNHPLAGETLVVDVKLVGLVSE